MAGVQQPFIATILKSVCGLAGVIIAIFFAQKVMGRRPMMLIGHGTATLFLLGAAIAGTVAPVGSIPGGKALLACLLIYHGVYNGFSSAISWPLSNELVSSRLRVPTMGTATGINYVFACEFATFHRLRQLVR